MGGIERGGETETKEQEVFRGTGGSLAKTSLEGMLQ